MCEICYLSIHFWYHAYSPDLMSQGFSLRSLWAIGLITIIAHKWPSLHNLVGRHRVDLCTTDGHGADLIYLTNSVSVNTGVSANIRELKYFHVWRRHLTLLHHRQ